VVHITLAVLVPRSLVAMFTGGPAIDSTHGEPESLVPEMKPPH
jgi:hypothetical protein